MQPIPQQVIETLQTLSPNDQQQVLDFAKFLSSKKQAASSIEQPISAGVSFLEAARSYIGSLEGGPSDLSTNKTYLEGLGEE